MGGALSAAAWRIAGGYALLAALSVALALALREGVPWIYAAPWLDLSPGAALATSAGLGLVLSAALVLLTRLCVRRFHWARRLHVELRPVARDLTAPQIAAIATLSSLGEELLFRGLLLPWTGVLPGAVLFGLAHYLPGRSRWVWVAWASVVGAALGAVFALTGSLVGPLVAHAIVNAINLAYLRSHDPNAATGAGAERERARRPGATGRTQTS
ncbi:MAG: CPBP family intramembrane metalloprotease [Deltaproteobacteria bacterium]|nr:CPBP family intramembrane metalloprotease [Deltaproteobacteria bacterium]